MNRGRRGPLESAAVIHQRFNEAPIHESGKGRTLIRARCVASGFNEAPIHESGKASRPAIAWSGTNRFNEAPIHESGKGRRFWMGRKGGLSASMRPRFMNRGRSFLDVLYGDDCTLLQ